MNNPASKKYPYIPQLAHSATLTGREPELSGLRALAAPPLLVHVDDDKGIRMLIRFILADHHGYRVESFYNGEDAFNFCRKERPMLLITDISRPGIDGLMLCKMIRDDSRLHDLNLMILSACPQHSIQTAADQLNATLVSKPCDPYELVRRIDGITVQAGFQVPLHLRA